MKRNGQIGQWGHRECNRVGNVIRACGNGDVFAPRKRERLTRHGNDSPRSRIRRLRDMSRRQVQRSRAEAVREMHPQLLPANGQMNHLTESGIVEIVNGERVRWLGTLLRSGP